MKQGNTALKRWVDSRLERDEQAGHVQHDPQEQRAARGFAAFQKNILRPNNTFALHPGRRNDAVPVAGIDRRTNEERPRTRPLLHA